MKLQIIQLEPYDDVVSVRDRLAFVQTERVLLVFPKRGVILQRKLDLVLIQRESTRRGTRLALVTTDLTVIDAACDLNISTFDSIQVGQQAAHWKQPLNKVFVDRSDRPADEPDPYEMRLIASRLRALTPEQRRRRDTARLLAIGILAIAVLAIVYVVLPGADVTLTLAQNQISTTVQLTADPSINLVDVEHARIPAALETIDVETQASIPTTGTTDVPTTLASGTVIFANQTNTEIPVPAGTVLLSTGSTPARFRTIEDVSVPAGINRTVTTTIRATVETPGPAGNVDANLIINIDGPLSKVLSVRNPDPTQGGTVRQQSIVTKADYQNLLIVAHEKLRQAALTQFDAQHTGLQLVAPDSIQIVPDQPEQTTYTAFIGDPADNLTLNLRAKVQALIIDELPAHNAALASLSAKIPPGQRLVVESVAYERTAVRAADANGQVVLVMTATGNVIPTVDLEHARQRIAGLSLTDAQNVLNHDLLLDPLRPPQITIYPSLFGRLPLLTIRINISTQG